MNRFLWPLIAFVLLMVVMFVGLSNADRKGIIRSPLIGQSAPTFDAPDLLDSAARVTSAQLSGGWHLVNVWGTWCVECRAEHATLLAISREGQVPVVGLDWKDNDDDAKAWLQQLGNPYQRVGADRDGRIAIDWGVYGAPESFLVDPSGQVRQKRTGAMSPELWSRCFLPYLSDAQPAIPADCT